MLDDPTFNKQLDATRWENKTHWFEAPLCVFNKIGSGVTLDRTVYPDPQFCADEYDKMYLKSRAIPCDCCNPPPGEPVCEPVPLEDHIRDMLQCTKTFEDFIGSKVKGKMTQEICSIISGDCPEFYWGNFNQNGSITVEKIIYGRGD